MTRTQLVATIAGQLAAGLETAARLSQQHVGLQAWSAHRTAQRALELVEAVERVVGEAHANLGLEETVKLERDHHVATVDVGAVPLGWTR